MRRQAVGIHRLLIAGGEVAVGGLFLHEPEEPLVYGVAIGAVALVGFSGGEEGQQGQGGGPGVGAEFGGAAALGPLQ